MSEVVRVRLYCTSGFASGVHEDEIEIGREEWDEWSDSERDKALDEAAHDHMNNHIEYGWEIIA